MPPKITEFQVRAALWALRSVDPAGTDSAGLDLAFSNAVTQGRFPRVDLDDARRRLLDGRLLVVEADRIMHSTATVELLHLPDGAAVPLLAALLTHTALSEWDDDVAGRALTGALGEEAVVSWCVDELQVLGHHELVEQVRRVSLVSDRFGYDVSAPYVGADSRKLEVKTSTGSGGKTFRFFLTRNEYEVGRRLSADWALVACASDGESASVLGWCRVSEFERYLPDDANGRWTEALVILPSSALQPGIPSAIA